MKMACPPHTNLFMWPHIRIGSPNSTCRQHVVTCSTVRRKTVEMLTFAQPLHSIVELLFITVQMVSERSSLSTTSICNLCSPKLNLSTTLRPYWRYTSQ